MAKAGWQSLGAGSNLGASSVRGGAPAFRGQGVRRSRAGAEAGRRPSGPVPCAARGYALIRPHVARVVGATHLQGGSRGPWERRVLGRRETAGRPQMKVHLMFASRQAVVGQGAVKGQENVFKAHVASGGPASYSPKLPDPKLPKANLGPCRHLMDRRQSCISQSGQALASGTQWVSAPPQAASGNERECPPAQCAAPAAAASAPSP